MDKLWAFILLTILWLGALCQAIEVRNNALNIVILVIMFLGFILVGLYELGKDEPNEK
jgi:hypothetical protein